ncbi:hypothetical protein T05_10045 [Trichinella murrelli]|uniref:Uncharacterized protein n=1 Tax=Trichinella murrelli TaxID=144512 RepID=A0A0V0TYU5_9BILA|nr:hypothetical protein T05_10045 [Trichinella murrelli]
MRTRRGYHLRCVPHLKTQFLLSEFHFCTLPRSLATFGRFQQYNMKSGTSMINRMRSLPKS